MTEPEEIFEAVRPSAASRHKRRSKPAVDWAEAYFGQNHFGSTIGLFRCVRNYVHTT